LLLMLLMLNWNRGESPSWWAEPQHIAFLFFFTPALAVLRKTVLRWRRKTEGQGVQWLEKQRRPWGKWAQAASMHIAAIAADGCRPVSLPSRSPRHRSFHIGSDRRRCDGGVFPHSHWRPTQCLLTYLLTYLQFSVIKWAKQRPGQNPIDVKSDEAIQI
jgi:hypothetical protein